MTFALPNALVLTDAPDNALSIDVFAGFMDMLRMCFQSNEPVAVCRLCRTVNRTDAVFCAGCASKMPAFYRAQSVAHEAPADEAHMHEWSDSADSAVVDHDPFPASADESSPDRCPDRGLRMGKEDLAAQLVRRAEEWIRRADPESLLRVLRSGGLSAVIEEDNGHFRTGIELSERRDALSGMGIIWADLSADETLSIFAEVWEASAPPADREAQEAWFVADAKAQEGARQWLRAEVADNIALFDTCAADWLSARDRPTGSENPAEGTWDALAPAPSGGAKRATRANHDSSDASPVFFGSGLEPGDGPMSSSDIRVDARKGWPRNLASRFRSTSSATKGTALALIAIFAISAVIQHERHVATDPGVPHPVAPTVVTDVPSDPRVVAPASASDLTIEQVKPPEAPAPGSDKQVEPSTGGPQKLDKPPRKVARAGQLPAQRTMASAITKCAGLSLFPRASCMSTHCAQRLYSRDPRCAEVLHQRRLDEMHRNPTMFS
jgi:hypothetical protein